MKVYRSRERIAFAIAGVLLFLPGALMTTYMLVRGFGSRWDVGIGALSLWLGTYVCARISILGRSFWILELPASVALGLRPPKDGELPRSNEELKPTATPSSLVE